MFIYKSRYLTGAEVWFDNKPDDTRSVDWILYQQRSHPLPGAKWNYFYTYIIDLTQSVEQLQANLNADTAYKIRRARQRDKIICESCNCHDPAVLDQFEEMYNVFAVTKGLQELQRARVDAMVTAGVLDLSVAKDPQGRALVYHANYRDRHRARSLYLPSLFRQLSDSAARNLVGRANRCLTWSDILRYKNDGLKCFDFGGWYEGNDPGMLKINEFKKGFGGQVVRQYECEQILTLRGWVVLNVAKLLCRSPRKKTVADPFPVQEPVAVPSS